MTTIYLKYGTYSSGTLTWSSSQEFDVPVYIEYEENDRITEKDVRGTFYSHLKDSRSVYEIKISANELADATNWTFLKTFYNADAWKISTDDWTTEKVCVLEESGRLEPEMLEGHKELREVVFHLVQKEKS
jgi:hypothetical protein